MKNLKIGQKLIISFAIIILAFILASVYQLTGLKKLGNIQQQTSVRASNAIYISEIHEISTQLYRVIASAIIQRNKEELDIAWKQQKEEVNTILTKVGEIMDTPEEKELLKNATSKVNEIINVFETKIYPLIFLKNRGVEQSNELKKLNASLLVLVTDSKELFEKIRDSIVKEDIVSEKQFQSASASMFLSNVIVMLFVIIVSVVFVYILQQLISKPLIKAVSFVKKVASGDLTDEIEINQKDEVGELINATNNMVVKMKEIISNIIIGIDNIADASSQLSSASQQMSQGASEQASSIEEVSSSMEEMSSTIQQNTDNSRQTEKIAISAADSIKEGNNAVAITVTSMKNIAEKIRIINDIAFQTNILALNAAVEAARAGEHGKGFAVVAAEVRKLAERSKVAADEIDALSVNGVRIAEDAGKKLSEIVPEIEKTAKLVQEIAASSIEQNTGADQVNTSIQQLNSVTQQNAAVAEELATSAEELASQAEELRVSISFFKLGGEVKTQFTRKPFTSGIQSKVNHIDETAAIKQVVASPARTVKIKSRGINLDMNAAARFDSDYEKF